MDDKYVKPGNQERGWNDPPQFSYGLQKAHGPQRNLLNKRAAPAAPGAPPSTTITSDPLAPPPCGVAPPPCGVAPPPLCPARPPVGGVATPPPPPTGPKRSQKEVDSSLSEREPDVENVMLVLNQSLTACRQTAAVPQQVCNDVAKRLRLLEDSWRSDRLSLPVRRRMEHLSLELRSGNWDSADELHRSLMVDHVTEVSQWMVGVKRLIAETRKLKPELSEPVQDPAEPAQDPAEPVQNPAEPVQDPAEPVQNPAEPALNPAEPALNPAEPVQNPAEPPQDPEVDSVSQS